MGNSGMQQVDTSPQQIPTENIEVMQVTEDNQVQQGQDEGHSVQVEVDPNVSVQEGQVQVVDGQGQTVQIFGQPVHVFSESEMVTEGQIISEPNHVTMADTHVTSTERSNVIEPGSEPHSGPPITVKVLSSNQNASNLPRKMISLIKTPSDIPGTAGKLQQIFHDSDPVDSKEQNILPEDGDQFVTVAMDANNVPSDSQLEYQVITDQSGQSFQIAMAQSDDSSVQYIMQGNELVPIETNQTNNEETEYVVYDSNQGSSEVVMETTQEGQVVVDNQIIRDRSKSSTILRKGNS